MDDRRVRKAVMLYVHGDVSEPEAARIAGIPRPQLRHYVRTCGLVSAGSTSANESGKST